MTRVIGIDPGINGCIALIDTETNISQWWDMPRLDKTIDCNELVRLLEEEIGKVDMFVIEHVWALPGQSSSAGFAFGKNIGVVHMLAAMAKCRFELVTPIKWKKHFGVNGIKGEDKKRLKEKAILKAKQRFPEHADKLLKSKDGRSEALLIAEYGVRVLI